MIAKCKLSELGETIEMASAYKTIGTSFNALLIQVSWLNKFTLKQIYRNR